MMRRLSPIVLPLGYMTEDSGTRPSYLAALIIDLMPEAFAAFYNHCLVASEWYTAGSVFAELLSSQPLNGSAIPVVDAALLGGTAIGALRNRAEAGNVHAKALMATNAKRFGLPLEDLGRKREHYNTPDPEDPKYNVPHNSAA